MALVGLSLDAVVDYESPDDSAKGTPEATVFQLGTISSRVMSSIRDKSTSFAADPTNPTSVSANWLPNQNAFETVRHGLKGWKNFRDAKGNDIKFEQVTRLLNGSAVQVVSDDCMDRLPIELIRELANELIRRNEPTKEEKKSPPTGDAVAPTAA